MEWYRVKLLVSDTTMLGMDALHLLVGFAAVVLFARLFNLSLGDGRPWLAVLVIELINEWSDLTVERWPNLAHQYGEGAKDIVVTMIVPTVLLLVARHHPRLLAWASIPLTGRTGDLPRRP